VGCDNDSVLLVDTANGTQIDAPVVPYASDSTNLASWLWWNGDQLASIWTPNATSDSCEDVGRVPWSLQDGQWVQLGDAARKVRQALPNGTIVSETVGTGPSRLKITVGGDDFTVSEDPDASMLVPSGAKAVDLHR
jgi:hypothetical protein